MEINRAKEIVTALAEGIDPITGEVLESDNVCNKGEVVRALYALLTACEDKNSKKNLPENAGKPWTQEDESLLKSLYQSGASKSEISKRLKRTASGVTARLAHLGLIENPYVFRKKD